MGQEQNILSALFMPVMLVGIMYFLIFKPQRDKQKKLQKDIAGLEKHDKIVTTGGIHGLVLQIKDKTLIVRIDEKTKIEIEKSSVESVLEKKVTVEPKPE